MGRIGGPDRMGDPPRAPAYDLTTLERARGGEPLHIDHGLACTPRWVARAAPAARRDLPRDGRPERGAIDPLTMPGHRAAMRALLDDCQRWIEGLPAPLSPLAVETDGGGGEIVWLCDPVAGYGIGIARAALALVGERERAVAVRRYQQPWVLTIRDGAIMAAIKGRALLPAPDGSGALPPPLRRHGGGGHRG